MTVYVDPLMKRGWTFYGREVASCHMFTDSICLDELHKFAEAIGMKKVWFQKHNLAPHYDLISGRRAVAIKHGAVAVDRRQAVAIWRARREAAAGTTP
jgi:hypothetical protein